MTEMEEFIRQLRTVDDKVHTMNPAIDTVVTQNSGVYHYQFTLTNTSQCGAGMGSPVIVDFELPLLSAESVYNITSPGSWDGSRSH